MGIEISGVSDRVTLLTPLITKERFTEYSGIRPAQIKTQAYRGNLPVIRLGKENFINVALLSTMSEDFEGMVVVPCPAMNPERFAAASGMDLTTVISNIRYGHLPVVKIGRLNCINVSELFRQCLKPIHAVK